MKYLKKQLLVEAMQWTGNNWDEIEKFAPYDVSCFNGKDLRIQTLEGQMMCHRGDYVIIGIDGELYPCKKEIFEKSYDKVEE